MTRRQRLFGAGALLMIVGAVMLAIHLHHRHDQLRERPAAVVDATPLFERLARGSFSVLEELRVDVDEGGAGWAPIATCLPAADEPWIATAAEVITRRQGRSTPPAVERLVEPRGLVLPGRVLVRLREGEAQPATLRVRELDTGVSRSADWPAGVSATVLPEDCALAPGQRYALEVFDAEESLLASASLTTLESSRVKQIRRLAAALKRRVSDPALLRYAQGVVAMSEGLHDRAAQLLLDGFERGVFDLRWPDLAWRRVFLFDRRGDAVRRDQLAARLRGL